MGPYLLNTSLISFSPVYRLRPNTPSTLDGSGSYYNTRITDNQQGYYFYTFMIKDQNDCIIYYLVLTLLPMCRFLFDIGERLRLLCLLRGGERE